MTARDTVAVLALWVTLGCTDTGIVGELNRCAPACAANQICHATLAICVECIENGDCSADEGGPYCADLACVECRANDDCAADAGVCRDGLCQQCATDLDCVSEQACQSGRCVATMTEEEEESDDHEADGAGEAGDNGN
jgi:hypothetical protein